MRKFTVIIEKARNNYSAYCPDLPGCVATGATPRAVEKNMKDAIAFHLEGLKEEGRKPPKKTVRVKEVLV